MFENEQLWSRDNDVFLVVPAKSGTTWLMATLHYIRGHGNPPPFRDVYEEIMWPEFIYYPGQTLEERVELYRNVSKKYPFSIYKTHKGPPELKIRKNAKYIICVRNFFDVAASFRSFLRHHCESFAAFWGGFPP